MLPAGILWIAIRIARDIASSGDNVPALKYRIEQTLAIQAVGSLWLAAILWL
jgi:hypothetical protein